MRIAKQPRDPHLKTQRLLLRPPNTDDLDALVAEVNDYDIAKMTARIPHPYKRSDGVAFLTQSAKDVAAGRAVNLALTLDSRIIGVASIFGLPYRPELGYWLGRAHWGKGITTEAAAAVCAWGFEVLGLSFIRALVATDNPASWRVQQKLGFRRTGFSVGRSLARGAEVAHIRAVLTPARFYARPRA